VRTFPRNISHDVWSLVRYLVIRPCRHHPLQVDLQNTTCKNQQRASSPVSR